MKRASLLAQYSAARKRAKPASSAIPLPGYTIRCCAICTSDFWVRDKRSTIFTCSDACGIQLGRKSLLAKYAFAAGENPNEKMFQRRHLKHKPSATRSAIWAWRSKRRSRRRALKRRAAELKAKLKAGTITFDDLRYAPRDLCMFIAKGLDMDIFTPAEAAALRKRMASIVGNSLNKVADILENKPGVGYSPAQVSLFKALLNKVVPDVTASFNVNENRNVTVQELSVEELRAIAAGRAVPGKQLALPHTAGAPTDVVDLVPEVPVDPVVVQPEGVE